ncbi:Asparagine synthetase domain-containing protein 1 [Entophlyctis luteolus]|nr:Asparagine synthetase domain-containing protein 1 [Entophlyctis luteolus]
MCGILLRVGQLPLPTGAHAGATTAAAETLAPFRVDAGDNSIWAHLAGVVARRGPDAVNIRDFSVRTADTTIASHATLLASVLHLRGPTPVIQPLVHRHRDLSESFFCWNGEVFNSPLEAPCGTRTPQLQVSPGESDTAAVFSALFSKSQTGSFDTAIRATLSSLRGPWAVLIYHAPSETVYFGRDVLGRRSLLAHFPSRNDPVGFIISSVAGCVRKREDVGTSAQSENVAADSDSDDNEVICKNPLGWVQSQGYWHEVPANGIYSLRLSALDLDGGPEAFQRALKHHPWVVDTAADNVVLASPTDLQIDKWVPDPVTLPNVLDPNVLPEETAETTTAVSKLYAHLSMAVRARVCDVPSGRISVLFSGGIDCTVLAALAAEQMASLENSDAQVERVVIDLINVAFENPRVNRALELSSASAIGSFMRKKDKKNGASISAPKLNRESGLHDGRTANPPGAFDVPDRITGVAGYHELRAAYPQIEWRFVYVDVPFEEAMQWRPWIMGLVHPLESVMDLSIAMAFWFAARGKGYVIDDNGNRKDYLTDAKVLLSGLGADEQLGGYNRHRKRFLSSGWPGLIAELQKDVSRISYRNLGRDDRIASDHGRELRFPYLDERVITILAETRVHVKTDPRFARGVGDKTLLRYLAARRLGLLRASREAKRAVQFGARTAKMVNGREKGEMEVINL